MNTSSILHPSSPAPRHGFSIVEAIVAMVIGSTIFGLSIELFVLAKRETAVGSQRTISTANLSRLGEQFRADVHAAETVFEEKRTGGRALWTIKIPDGERVEYEPRAEGLRRTEYRGDKVHSRDTFALPTADARLELKPAEKPVEATLLIKERACATDAMAGSDLRIEATVGRDLRFVEK